MVLEKKLELKTMNQFLFLEINDRVNRAFGSRSSIPESLVNSLEIDYETLNSIGKDDKELKSSRFLIENLILKIEFLLDKGEI